MLWVLVGGIFFGAVHDFGALYASMKNNGKSLAQLIEKYIGKTGRRLFLLFSWLFCLIVIAAFTSMVAGTFKMTPADGGAVSTIAKSYYGAAAGTISLLFTFVAIAFGWFCRKFDLKGWKQFVCAVVLIVAHVRSRHAVPNLPRRQRLDRRTMAYLVFACAMPIQTLKQPRDYLTTIMMVVMIVAAVLGIFAHGRQRPGRDDRSCLRSSFTNASGQLPLPRAVRLRRLRRPLRLPQPRVLRHLLQAGL
jgi:carbon starvation protein